MSDEHAALRQVVNEILTDRIDHARVEAAETGFATSLWAKLDDCGFATVAVPAHAGGAGGTVADLATILRTCGYHAAPVPLAESNVAAFALAQAGLDIPDGPLTIAELAEQPRCRLVRADDRLRVAGSLSAVPWAGPARGVVVTGEDGHVGLTGVVCADEVANPTHNIAGEPTADIELPADGVALTAVSDGSPMHLAPARLLALTRVLLMTGSLRRVLALAVQYAREREQFGRPIAAFQAIGHQLAVLAGAIEQADAIADAAVATVAAAEPAHDIVLAAKICAGEAATLAIRTGHQVHGAIGVTREHELHHHTRRLMAWRDCGGSEAHAALTLGRRIAHGGADAVWGLLTHDPAGTT